MVRYGAHVSAILREGHSHLDGIDAGQDDFASGVGHHVDTEDSTRSLISDDLEQASGVVAHHGARYSIKWDACTPSDGGLAVEGRCRPRSVCESVSGVLGHRQPRWGKAQIDGRTDPEGSPRHAQAPGWTAREARNN